MHGAHEGLGSAVRLARRQHGLITTRQALGVGLTPDLLRHLVRSGIWLRARQGIYVLPGATLSADGEVGGRLSDHGPPPDSVPSRWATSGAATSGAATPGAATAGATSWPAADFTDPTAKARLPFRLRVRAALLARPGAVACGVTAGRLLGFEGLPRPAEDEPVHLRLPVHGSRRQMEGTVSHFGPVAVGDLVELDGIPLTGPDRTLADLVLAGSREDAVAMIDAALRRRLVTGLDRVIAACVKRPGARRVASYWALADGRAESVLETHLRLLLHDAGVPPPCIQWPVTDGTGRVLARLDLAWPGAMLDVEADGGAVHELPSALHRDRERQNQLLDLGWRVRRVTWADVLRTPTKVVAAVTGWLAAGP
ncbi:hypothetical protein E0504_25715 [Parafrankia sp. BMG5.11]|nr:hypothetical protein E0504_25715 [Parafrankia sp. BMG5.11]